METRERQEEGRFLRKRTSDCHTYGMKVWGWFGVGWVVVLGGVVLGWGFWGFWVCFWGGLLGCDFCGWVVCGGGCCFLWSCVVFLCFGVVCVCSGEITKPEERIKVPEKRRHLNLKKIMPACG